MPAFRHAFRPRLCAVLLGLGLLGMGPAFGQPATDTAAASVALAASA